MSQCARRRAQWSAHPPAANASSTRSSGESSLALSSGIKPSNASGAIEMSSVASSAWCTAHVSARAARCPQSSEAYLRPDRPVGASRPVARRIGAERLAVRMCVTDVRVRVSGMCVRVSGVRVRVRVRVSGMSVRMCVRGVCVRVRGGRFVAMMVMVVVIMVIVIVVVVVVVVIVIMIMVVLVIMIMIVLVIVRVRVRLLMRVLMRMFVCVRNGNCGAEQKQQLNPHACRGFEWWSAPAERAASLPARARQRNGEEQRLRASPRIRELKR